MGLYCGKSQGKRRYGRRVGIRNFAAECRIRNAELKSMPTPAGRQGRQAKFLFAGR